MLLPLINEYNMSSAATLVLSMHGIFAALRALATSVGHLAAPSCNRGHVQRAAERRDNYWVVKLAQGARSADVFISDSVEAIVCHRAAPGDRIAQACVRRPVLFRGCKVDLRVRVC